MKKINEIYNAGGFRLLSMADQNFRVMTANKKIQSMEDFRGIKIRTMENSNHMAFWQAIGAEPTPLAWSELYISLQNGTVDAEENAADSILGASFQEVQDYLACTNHILYCNQVCINNQAWNDLPKQYQEALTEAVEEAIAEMRPLMTQIDEDSKAALQAGGMEMITYDDSFFTEVLARDSVQALYAAIDEQTNGLAATLVDVLG